MPNIYTTTQGDMWDSIAYRQMGNEKYMHFLIEENSQYNQIVVFPANIKLTIPDVPVSVSTNLPPWKR